VFDPTDRDFKMGDVLREEVWNNAFELYMSVRLPTLSHPISWSAVFPVL
jgi:hypothetical protein